MIFKKYELRAALVSRILLFLLPLLFFAASFRQVAEIRKDIGSFYATVDGMKFMVLEDQLFRGLLVNKALSRDERIAPHTVISTIFNGPTYTIPEEKSFTESVQFEIAYQPDKLGEPSYYALALLYRSISYYLIRERSKLSVTEYKWDTDKKHFRLSAEFDCRLRSQGSPEEEEKELSLRGKMTDIRITVPSWIDTKN